MASDESPYAAPKALVAHAEVLPQPPAVRRALICLWSAVVINNIYPVYMLFFSTRLIRSGAISVTALVASTMVMLGMLGLQVLLNIMIAQGRNWARIFYIVIGAIGLLANLYALGFSRWSGLNSAAQLVGTVLNAGALVLLLTQSAQNWFMAVKERRSQSRP